MSVACGQAFWVSDQDRLSCAACTAEFGLFVRRHHCRRCGTVACGACSARARVLVARAPPVRVCVRCDAELARLERTPPARPQAAGGLVEPSPPWQL